MKRIEVKEIVMLVNWISQVDEKLADEIFSPKKNEEGDWISEVRLPLIDKTVIGLGQDKLVSIKNMAVKASQLIKEYMKEHPKIKVKDLFGADCYDLVEDDDGYISIEISKKEIKKQELIETEIFTKMQGFGKSIIDEFEEKLGTYGDLYLSVKSVDLFEKGLSEDQMIRISSDSIKHNKGMTKSTSFIKNGLVVTIGLTKESRWPSELN